MNPKHVHTPVSTRARCPVCHQAVYSRGGIHPQCAVRQSEPPRPKNNGLAVVPLADEANVEVEADRPTAEVPPAPL